MKKEKKKEIYYPPEVYHKLPHLTINSPEELKNLSFVPEVIRMEVVPRLPTLRKLKRMGVTVIKLPPSTFDRFIRYLGKVRMMSIPPKNPTKIRMREGEIIVVKTKPLSKGKSKKIGRPKAYLDRISDILLLFREGKSYRQIAKILGVPKSSVERYVKRFASPEDWSVREWNLKLKGGKKDVDGGTDS